MKNKISCGNQMQLFGAFTFIVLMSALLTNDSLAQVTVGTNEFITIQAALDFVEANPPGDGQPVVINVEPGVYCEMLVMPETLEIRLEGTDPSNMPILKGPGTDVGDTISCSQSPGQDDIEHVLVGFIVTNGRNGISVRTGCSFMIVNCSIQENDTGIDVVGGNVNTVDTNLLANNLGIRVTNNGESAGSADVDGSDIINNTGPGFVVVDSGGGGNATLDFSETQIIFNFGAGILIGDNAQVDLSGANGITENRESLPGANDGGITIFRDLSGNTPMLNVDGVAFVRNQGPDLNFIQSENDNFTDPNGAANGSDPNVPIIRNCTFSDGVTDMFFGGASGILTDGVDVIIIDCEFSGNESNNDGAAVVCKGGANLMMMGCRFENNISLGSFDEGAGAILCDSASPIIIDCKFISNTALIECGAIRNINGAAPLIQYCMFVGNQADRVAGAIINQSSSNPMIVDCSFEMNMTTNASSEGGAIVNQGASPAIDNCTFTGNQSDDGGVIFSEDSGGIVSHPNITNCQFVGNIATGTGGAADFSGANGVLENCQFDGNQSSSSGGAISFNDSLQNDPVLVLTNCSFANHNVAVDGAAIVGSDGSAVFDSCSFVSNSAGRNGGALRILSSNIVFKFCDFENNSAAEHGGAIGCFNSTLGTHIGCTFAGNHAGEFGGAVYYSESAIASYFSCEFSGNASDLNGGAITTLDLPGDTISNCTFTNNSATNLGGAIFANNNTIVAINNSIIWENGTGALHVSPGSTADVNFSNVQGGIAGVGNMDADPMFTNEIGADGITGTLDDDLSLKSTSTMIDAGNNNSVPEDELDLDGDGDVNEPIPLDLRMMLRFVDDPGVADVGIGLGPIIDLGAIEFATSKFLVGDVNQDGVVNLLDIAPFIELLATSSFQAEADVNQDGVVNLLDVDPFVAILSG